MYNNNCKILRHQSESDAILWQIDKLQRHGHLVILFIETLTAPL